MADEPEKQELPEGAVVLSIVMLKDKTLSVQGGAIGDIGLCYQMLELARDAVFVNAMNARAQQEGARLQAEMQAQEIRRRIGGENGRPRIVT